MTGLDCRLVAWAADASVGLSFALANRSDGAVTFEREDPFTEFRLRVRAGGDDVLLHAGPSSYQVQAVQERVEPGGELVLHTPVTLLFDPDVVEAELPDFVYGIPLSPQRLEIEAQLTIGGLSLAPCRAVVEPSAAA